MEPTPLKEIKPELYLRPGDLFIDSGKQIAVLVHYDGVSHYTFLMCNKVPPRNHLPGTLVRMRLRDAVSVYVLVRGEDQDSV